MNEIEKKKQNKSKTAAEENKLKMDEEDRKEFTMKGKPYKDKFNGQRLSKLEYNTKFPDKSDRIKLNFLGSTVDEYGQLMKKKGAGGERSRKNTDLADVETSKKRKYLDNNLLLPPSSHNQHRKYTSQG